MKNAFIIGGGSVGFSTDTDLKIVNQLPPGNYTLTETKKGFILTPTRSFAVATKLYGDYDKYADRVLTTYKQRERNTGVLLSGVKGSGKSEMLRLICNKAAKENIPSILINSSIENISGLFSFLADIEQPMVVALDEFDKTFSDEDAQAAMLSFLDGTSVGSGHLFVLTANREDKLSQYLMNRPGRIYYKRDFTILEDAVIEEYCKQNLKGWTEERMSGIWEAVAYVESVSFDILKALIEEMNRFGEDGRTAMGYLNVSPVQNLLYTYKATCTVDEKEVSFNWPVGSESRNPLTQRTIVVFETPEKQRVECSQENMTSADYRHGVYVFKKGNTCVTLNRVRDYSFKI